MSICIPELHTMVAERVSEMPAHEERFWRIAEGFGVDRIRADHMLDIAVEWISSGRTEHVDPYRVAENWLPRF